MSTIVTAKRKATTTTTATTNKKTRPITSFFAKAQAAPGATSDHQPLRSRLTPSEKFDKLKWLEELTPDQRDLLRYVI